MKTWKERFKPKTLILAGLGLLFLLFIAFAMRPQPQPVDAAVVARGSLQVSIDEEGETRVRDRYVVSSPLAARILRIELEPGDPVREGVTVVATLRPADPSLLDARAVSEAQARVRAAEAAVATAKAERDQAAAEVRYADADLARFAKLHEEKSSPRSSSTKPPCGPTPGAKGSGPASSRCAPRSTSSSWPAPPCGRPAATARRRSRSARRSTAWCCDGCAKAKRWWRPARRCSSWARRATSKSCPTCCRPTR